MFASNETPTDAEVRNYEKKREDKKVSNDEWVSRGDPDALIKRRPQREMRLFRADFVSLEHLRRMPIAWLKNEMSFQRGNNSGCQRI